MQRFIAALFIFFAAFAATAQSTEKAKMDTFINGLMKKMTLEEKVGQLVQYTGESSVTGATVKDNYREEIEKGRVGSLLNAYGPQGTRDIQKIAVEKTRLKIPLLFGYDVIHGHRTIFPIPLGEAASWDLGAIEKSARISAIEAAAEGIHWTFAPMVDIARDPRWGRVSEGSGEDPYLGSRVAEVKVRGFQGKDLRAHDSILATVKHFALYGAPEAGRDYNIVDMSERTMWESYLPPYEAAVKAGAATVMTSFNEINGVPATGNKWLMTDLLRKQWGFKGFIVTDYTAINEMIPHGVAANEPEAGLLAFNAGVDMDMVGAIYAKHLPGQIKKGQASQAMLDASVRRILEAKYKLGLFYDPYRGVDVDRAKKLLLSPEHQAHARDAARRSLVLLKNENAVLPLKKSGTIALIGPFVENKRDQIGNWSAAGEGKYVVNLLEGVSEAVKDTKTKIIYAKGANLLDDKNVIEFLNKHGGDLVLDEKSPEDMIKDAVRSARRADVVVMALGEPSTRSGEAASVTRIQLSENQQKLIKAVKETGKPIVLVLFNGRPLAIEMESQLADAVVVAWFPGTQAGPAVADVLFGDYNPSGKLPMTFPRSEGQIPIYYAARPTGRPATKPEDKYVSKYLDSPNTPLYPFGWGLSYTKFDYTEPKLSTSKLRRGQKLKVSVTVANTGERDGEEVVQLYVRDMVGSVTRPLKQLRGFQKIALKKGERREVAFELTMDDLKLHNGKKWLVESGEFRVMVGGSSADVKEAAFQLL